MSIKINTGFLNQSKTPLDSRQVVDTLDDLLALDTNIIYNGLECYVSSLDCKYKYHEDYNETSTGNWKLSTGGGGDSSVTLTQQEYEALSEEQKLNGLYYTYDTKRIYKNGVQYGASEPIPLTMEEYKALKEASAIDEQQEYLIEANTEGILLGAEDIGYNNAESGIQATTVQDAIDNVVEKVDGLISDTTSSTTSTWSSKKTSDEIAKKVDKSYVDNNFATMDKVGDNIIVTPHTQIGAIYTITPNDLNRIEIDVAKSGYTCIGLLSLQDNHGSYTQFKGWYIENNKVVVHVLAGEEFSDYVILASLLYKKN